MPQSVSLSSTLGYKAFVTLTKNFDFDAKEINRNKMHLIPRNNILQLEGSNEFNKRA